MYRQVAPTQLQSAKSASKFQRVRMTTIPAEYRSCTARISTRTSKAAASHLHSPPQPHAQPLAQLLLADGPSDFGGRWLLSVSSGNVWYIVQAQWLLPSYCRWHPPSAVLRAGAPEENLLSFYVLSYGTFAVISTNTRSTKKQTMLGARAREGCSIR